MRSLSGVDPQRGEISRLPQDIEIEETTALAIGESNTASERGSKRWLAAIKVDVIALKKMPPGLAHPGGILCVAQAQSGLANEGALTAFGYFSINTAALSSGSIHINSLWRRSCSA